VKTIKVSDKVWEKLIVLKVKNRCKSIDEFLEKLLEKHIKRC